jgi:hypothetical protein
MFWIIFIAIVYIADKLDKHKSVEIDNSKGFRLFGYEHDE